MGGSTEKTGDSPSPSAPNSTLLTATSFVASILGRLRHYQRCATAGRRSVHQYHMNGLYSIRTYMGLLARYAHIEECIGRVTSDLAQLQNQTWKAGLMALRRDLTAVIKYGDNILYNYKTPGTVGLTAALTAVLLAAATVLHVAYAAALRVPS